MYSVGVLRSMVSHVVCTYKEDRSAEDGRSCRAKDNRAARLITNQGFRGL